jgi:hypothetical protein
MAATPARASPRPPRSHPFNESDIMTSGMVRSKFDGSFQNENGINLIDMEAAGVYQASIYDYQPHQLSFLKVVSDHGNSEKLNPEKVTCLMESHMDVITQWLKQRKQAVILEKPLFTMKEEQCMKVLADNIHCSVTMEYMLRQQLLYYKLLHGGFEKEIDEFCFDKKLPCNTKAEGKRYFDELKARFT